jgi:hypothetical protein
MLGKLCPLVIADHAYFFLWKASIAFSFFLQFSYNIEQEQKLATETTVLVEQYTVSTFK